MKNDILFLSDLHLAIDKPQITKLFLQFLTGPAGDASEVYILGDLFDAWIGDDDPTPPNNTVRTHLKALTDSGTRVYLQPGNRDFLIGDRFCAETGVKPLDDYAVLDLYGTPTLLTHGDLLCTDDTAYQTFRQRSHTPEWRRNVLSKPLFVRLLAARWYRFKSFLHKRKQSLDIMDVNPDTVCEVLTHYHCKRLIHGHTHRPCVHTLAINGETMQRFVLPAWDKEQGGFLCWQPDGYSIESV